MRDSERIRVYLAPKDLLQAIFDDPAVVNEVINTRQDLYKSAVKSEKPADIDKLSTAFMTQFIERRDPSVSGDLLDFTVNKTNPKEYEKSPSAK